MPVRSLPDILEATCRAHGDRPGFDFFGKTWTWAEIGALTERFAKGLQASGIGRGSKVGLFLPNSPYYLVSYYAVLKAGAIVVNLNPLYAERELHLLIEDSEADAVITVDLKMLYDKMLAVRQASGLKKLIVCRFAEALPFPKNVLFRILKGGSLAQVRPSDDVTWFHDLTKSDEKPAAVVIDPRRDIAVLQYTGGTTGTPKGAMLTHANLSANVEQCALWFQGAKPGQERMLGVIPFFHVFAMTAVMNLSVRYGFEIIALPQFRVDETLKAISRKKPHYFPAVPAIYNAINNHPQLGKFDLRSLRACISGGAPLPVEVKRLFEKNTGCIVVEGYGLTESSPVVCANPFTGENRAGSIGLPLPGTIVEIVDPDDRTAVVARGELCVRGPQVMRGYWNRPAETKEALVDGRLHTGDIATMDADGYVYIVDRIKDMIITNGYKVYPRNVEEVIYLHPAVEECIVAGVPDKDRGEAVKVWIKAKPGRRVTEDELKAHMKDKLSPMEIPRLYEFRYDPLPKTMIGKLSRKGVLEQEEG